MAASAASSQIFQTPAAVIEPRPFLRIKQLKGFAASHLSHMACLRRLSVTVRCDKLFSEPQHLLQILAHFGVEQLPAQLGKNNATLHCRLFQFKSMILSLFLS